MAAASLSPEATVDDSCVGPLPHRLSLGWTDCCDLSGSLQPESVSVIYPIVDPQHSRRAPPINCARLLPNVRRGELTGRRSGPRPSDEDTTRCHVLMRLTHKEETDLARVLTSCRVDHHTADQLTTHTDRCQVTTPLFWRRPLSYDPHRPLPSHHSSVLAPPHMGVTWTRCLGAGTGCCRGRVVTTAAVSSLPAAPGPAHPRTGSHSRARRRGGGPAREGPAACGALTGEASAPAASEDARWWHVRARAG